MTGEPQTAWLGHATTNSATVIVVTATDGDVTVLCDGRKHGPVASDQTVNFGIVKVTINGLTPGKHYGVCPVLLDGTIIAYVHPSTMPASGKFAVAWASCVQSHLSRDFTFMFEGLRKRYNIRACFFLGDCPYADDTRSTYLTNNAPQEWCANNTDAQDADVGALHYLNWHLYTDKNWCSRVPSYFMWDDHELGIDNWDNTLDQAQNGGSHAWTPTQVIADNHFAVARDVIDAFYIGNPANNSPLAIAEKPPSADASTPTSNYSPIYYKVKISDFEIWVPDCISYRGDIHATDTSATKILGANQETWLLTELANSESPVKAIMSTKKTYQHSGNDNPDGWGGTGYSAARDTMLSTIHSASGWVSPGGLVWCTGDRHEIEIMALDTDDGDSIDHLCVNPCPSGLTYPIAQSAGTASSETKMLVPIDDEENAIGIIEYDTDAGTAEVFMYNNKRGVDWGPAQLSAGSNKLTYKTRKTS